MIRHIYGRSYARTKEDLNNGRCRHTCICDRIAVLIDECRFKRQNLDFFLTPKRDRDAAEAFLRKAIRNQGVPEKITIDQSGSNTAAIKRYNRAHKTGLAIRQCKYLNNIVEQDHRAVKRKVRPMLGFKSFWAARCTIAGIEIMHAIRKGQLETAGTVSQTPAEQFYALAA